MDNNVLPVSIQYNTTALLRGLVKHTPDEAGMELNLTQWQKQRDDKLCEPVEAELDVPAFLGWLNRHDNFASTSFYITNAILVGRPVEGRNELRVYLVLHLYASNHVACTPFEFHQDLLEPFLRESVLRERAWGE